MIRINHPNQVPEGKYYVTHFEPKNVTIYPVKNGLDAIKLSQHIQKQVNPKSHVKILAEPPSREMMAHTIQEYHAKLRVVHYPQGH